MFHTPATGSKRRWSKTEKEAFAKIFKAINMPSKQEMQMLKKALPDRTAAMIRTRCHNILHGKIRAESA